MYVPLKFIHYQWPTYPPLHFLSILHMLGCVYTIFWTQVLVLVILTFYILYGAALSHRPILLVHIDDESSPPNTRCDYDWCVMCVYKVFSCVHVTWTRGKSKDSHNISISTTVPSYLPIFSINPLEVMSSWLPSYIILPSYCILPSYYVLSVLGHHSILGLWGSALYA